MKRRCGWVVLAWTGLAAAVEPAQFASGIALEAEAGRPVQELSLPDAVYAGVLRADLGDLRVFNAQHLAVPHALCAAPASLAAAPPHIETQALPVYAVRAAADASAGPMLVQVQAEDLSVRVERPQPAPSLPPSAARLSGTLIDARGAAAPIRALRLRWQTADGASEVAVRVEASTDLDRWHTVVARSTLLRVEGGALERAHVELPPARYDYLRVVRAEDGPAPQIDAVVAETVHTTAAEDAPYSWFEASAGASSAAEFVFDAGRRAPVQTARIGLPLPNMTLQLALESRADAQAPWRARWSGEVFALSTPEGERRNADIRLAPVTDRHWRLRVARGAESLGDTAPALQLGYRPERLRFLAQGTGPFLLAYGSAHSAPAPARRCADLLQSLPSTELDALIGRAQAGAARALGGEAARKPPRDPPPLRQIALWGLLVLAAALLVAMALSLLRRARSP